MKMKYKKSDHHLVQKFGFGRSFTDQKKLQALSLTFRSTGYVKLPGLFDAKTFARIWKEITQLAVFARARNLIMSDSKTPRFMTTLGGKEIKKHSTLLRALYLDIHLRLILSTIVGHQLFDSLDGTEWCVGTFLNGEGQTHGFHLDDPPIALIVIGEAPPPEFGGVLEMIPQWREISEVFQRDPESSVGSLVEKLRDLGLVQTKIHRASDAYLLRADRCLHSVAPLRGINTRRTILNMAFELAPNVVRESKSASELFDGN
jgi:hypothetical protein